MVVKLGDKVGVMGKGVGTCQPCMGVVLRNNSWSTEKGLGEGGR